MKRAAAGLLLTIATVGGALAQGSPPTQTAHEVRAQCQSEASAQGIRGASRRAYVNQCIATLRPDVARADYCRKIGKSNGLDGAPLKAYVKSCKTGV